MGPPEEHLSLHALRQWDTSQDPRSAGRPLHLYTFLKGIMGARPEERGGRASKLKAALGPKNIKPTQATQEHFHMCTAFHDYGR